MLLEIFFRRNGVGNSWLRSWSTVRHTFAIAEAPPCSQPEERLPRTSYSALVLALSRSFSTQLNCVISAPVPPVEGSLRRRPVLLHHPAVPALADAWWWGKYVICFQRMSFFLSDSSNKKIATSGHLAGGFRNLGDAAVTKKSTMAVVGIGLRAIMGGAARAGRGFRPPSMLRSSLVPPRTATTSRGLRTTTVAAAIHCKRLVYREHGCPTEVPSCTPCGQASALGGSFVGFF